MHVRTYKRNRRTIGALTAAQAAGIQILTHKDDFSVRLGGKWQKYTSAEEVVAALQGAAAYSVELANKLEAKGFPAYSSSTL